MAKGSLEPDHLTTPPLFSMDASSSVDGPGEGPIINGSFTFPFPPNIPPFFAAIVDDNVESPPPYPA